MAQSIVNSCGGSGLNRDSVNGGMRDHRGFLVIVARHMC